MSTPAPTTVWLRLELLTEVVFSRRNASVGLHECLDYVPGSALLGAAAARLYAESGFGPQFFLSGDVRFGDGLPDNNSDGPAWPAPLNWHVVKGDKPETDSLHNLLTAQPPSKPQLVQVRDRHLMANGRRATLHKRYQLKTALERQQHGRAKDETLHGYDALPAGTVFFAPVAFAADVAEKERTRLLALLTGGSVRLGRSRSAQYGGVRITRAQPACSWPKAGSALPDALVLYLASDLALCQANGAPTYIPEPAHFGLPAAARYLPSRSFIRTRRYAPWNAFRQAHDAERQVLLRGSVLAFHAPAGLDRAALAARLEAEGTGLHTSEGLGRVFVDPEFVLRPPAAPNPPQPAVRASSTPVDNTLPATPAMPANPEIFPLAHCLRARAEARRLDQQARQLALTWVGLFMGYRSPSMSQWNDVRNIVVAHEDWRKRLEAHFHLTSIRPPKRAEIWRDSLGRKLLDNCDGLKDPALARAVLRETITAIVRQMQTKGHR